MRDRVHGRRYMNERNMNPVLAGLAILVVEDELLAALDLSFMIRALGATVIGPAGTLEKAQALVRANVLSGAILDVKLDHTTSLPLAEELLDAGEIGRAHV